MKKNSADLSLAPQHSIAALATAPAPAGVAVIRVSGTQSKSAVKALFRSRLSPIEHPREMCFGSILNHKNGDIIDHGLCVYMPGPRSFTGEDIVEFHAHGSPLIAKRILQSLFAFGITPAEPGEFTKRAFLNGKIDLVQAEAIGELISATSESALRIASDNLAGKLSRFIEHIAEPLRDLLAEVQASLDFPEEDISPSQISEMHESLTKVQSDLHQLLESFTVGKRMREGYKILLCGPPNAGKSSLLNALLGRARALVSDVSGTTRDFIEEECILGHHRFVICDSAGITETDDAVEKLGIELSLEKLKWADLVLLVIDATEEYPDIEALTRLVGKDAKNIWMLTNKVDKNKSAIGQYYCDRDVCKQNFYLSVKTADGLDALRNALIEEVEGSQQNFSESNSILTQARQAHLVERAIFHLHTAAQALAHETGLEFVSEELRLALLQLEEIVGRTFTEDLLGRIFSKFCIGK
ncbi:tRNA uridine-5-carboxymethylaminomethyl(34) synthesis GTPase MnmE [bacterium]|nr:tRNA uridine-5-carboxymethylaminomethyl(34) synthesis GTPase MnmE [bacterium]